MAISLDNVDPDNMTNTFTLVAEGWYQVWLDTVKSATSEKGDKYTFVWTIVGAPPDLKQSLHRTVRDFLNSWTDLFPQQICRIGLALGIFTVADLKTWKAQGTGLPDQNYDDWCGKFCIVHVSHKPGFPDKSKTFANVDQYLPMACTEKDDAQIILADTREQIEKEEF
jgi:hypothetical protein